MNKLGALLHCLCVFRVQADLLRCDGVGATAEVLKAAEVLVLVCNKAYKVLLNFTCSLCGDSVAAK
ncbi:hypothetical protein [Iodobacter fluviatilis]|uniref:hypothetical protein n=1 Tax=Iodobacter fluviatilis TaxID=537 RepID=UPI000E1BAAFD|nr:hypothetical protein [Iodobacter fluviatilis]